MVTTYTKLHNTKERNNYAYRRKPCSKHHHCPTKLKKHSTQMLHCNSQLNRFSLDLTTNRCIPSAAILPNTLCDVLKYNIRYT